MSDDDVTSKITKNAVVKCRSESVILIKIHKLFV